MAYYTHVVRGTIDHNRKFTDDKPPLVVRKGKRGKPTYAHEVDLPPGSKLVYAKDGETILPCGARCVIVSDDAPTIVR